MGGYNLLRPQWAFESVSSPRHVPIRIWILNHWQGPGPTLVINCLDASVEWLREKAADADFMPYDDDELVKEACKHVNSTILASSLAKPTATVIAFLIHDKMIVQHYLLGFSLLTT